MSETSLPVSILPESECWKLLSNIALGRLVTTVDGQPEIFPVNFAVQGAHVAVSDRRGTKLVSAARSTSGCCSRSTSMTFQEAGA